MANTDTQPIRVRIAPSPTGNLHVGTARAALFNELFARQKKGTFIVRIEDTDLARSKPEYEENIIEGLHWLGLQWAEGPDTGGESGPYRQSERKALYEKALRQLIDSGKAYFCYCAPKGEGDAPVCSCSLDPKEDENFAVRLKVPPQTVTFTDLIRGEVTVHTDSFGGDFIIARSLKDPLYHLAVVVDDAMMDISHVIRGEDHVSNTAKHILLQQALGYQQPQYAHLPLLLDETRRKLSKRRGETSLLAFRELGYLPEAMLNYLALLGWNPGDDREFFSHEELIKVFSLDQVQKSGAIFSLIKLNAMNKHYIRQLSPDKLLAAALPFLHQAGIDTSNPTLIQAALLTEQERVSTLAELPAAIAFFLPGWSSDFPAERLIWKKSDKPTTIALLQKLCEKLEEDSSLVFEVAVLQDTLMAWIDAEEMGRGDTLWPMRVALTGREHSPGPFEVTAVLGKQETVTRLKSALAKLAA